jgi:hypothetical protein
MLPLPVYAMQDVLLLNIPLSHFYFKENEKLESQVRSQKRVIDKLKDEQRSTLARKSVLQLHNPSSTKGKENVDHSPDRKSPVSSPNVKSLWKYR